MNHTIKIKQNKGDVVIYKSSEGPEIRVTLENETIWLDAQTIARVFSIDRTVIVKHIGNIYKTGELDEQSTCAKIAQVAADGKVRRMNMYNLDVILSVGYRVNSKNATQFRMWATKTLKKHLLEGYTVNEKRLLQARANLIELQNTIAFIREKSERELLSGKENDVFLFLSDYSKTLVLLYQYDKNTIPLSRKRKGSVPLSYSDVQPVVFLLREKLVKNKQAGELFGAESGDKLEGILQTLYQRFNSKELYTSLEEKAAHLLYFIIKDHPFIDGNKRIASMLFIIYLDRNKFLYRASGEKRISDTALTALTLLIAISDPKEKDIMIRIITSIIAD